MLPGKLRRACSHYSGGTIAELDLRMCGGAAAAQGFGLQLGAVARGAEYGDGFLAGRGTPGVKGGGLIGAAPRVGTADEPGEAGRVPPDKIQALVERAADGSARFRGAGCGR
jgi:hypothetical protein